ncbi:type II secretion system protein E [bacterium BMS3Abin10]|nr:type II secretion system protein E [bacterium BMS3Abin10]GBE39605.1 type II secretion system protein E [bacterium BMS3Bbin08]HDH50587.1 type II/IV secretion system protein [Nitrospirota bacterium]HDK17588.1 type II/IV secretion system protein [Nitrospirota bacterium]
MCSPITTKGDIVNSRTLDRFKQAMVIDNLITAEKLRAAEDIAQQKNKPLINVLVEMGLLTKEKIISFLGEKFHIPYVNITDYTIDRETLDYIPEKIARRYNVIPLFIIENILTVAVSDPMDIIALDEISAVANRKIEPVIAAAEGIGVAIDQWYGVGNTRKELIEQLAKELQETEREKQPKYTGVAEIRLKKEASEPPVVQLVNSFIAQAILEGVSDIHLEPRRNFMAVRFRIDGLLYDRHKIPARFIAPITSRIKIMSAMDISLRRVPQDGRMSLNIRDKRIDVRTSNFPSMFGENIVLRLLDKNKGVPALSELGMSGRDLDSFGKMVKAKKGIILITGPTGSGKTTTIYSAINTMQKESRNIITIEDPVEYEIEGLVQGQVDPKVGVTFASALRSILRQDPDIIYVGEIRDHETAEISVRSALTGHLVISTLHTNDAAGTIIRLMDIGIDPGLIASVLNCSMAQRLIRRVCPRCKKQYGPDSGLLKELDLPADAKYYRSEGCDYCNGIGYKGRIGIYEILVISREVRKLIDGKSSENEIIKMARSQGMRSMFEDGLRKALKGITTIDEVRRATEE